MRRYLVSAIALVLAGGSIDVVAKGATPAAAGASAVQTTTQLPRGVRPTHYTVAVTPHAQALTFDGQVAITLDVLAYVTTLIAIVARTLPWTALLIVLAMVPSSIGRAVGMVGVRFLF